MVYGRMSAFGVNADIAKLQLLTEKGVPPDSFARALFRTCDPSRSIQRITVLKMTPPMLLLVGTRLNDKSSLYFASTLEAEEA
jgi:hypothetical protein